MSRKKWMDELLDAAREVAGGNVTIQHTKSGHYCLRIETPEGPRSVYVPGSPSDWRTVQNTKRDVRAVLTRAGGMKP